MAKRRLKDIRIKELSFNKDGNSRPEWSTMKIETRVAQLIRRVAKYEGKRLSRVLEEMLVAYAKERDWTINVQDEA